MRKVVVSVLLTFVLCGLGLAQQTRDSDDLKPNGKGWGEKFPPGQAGKARPSRGSGINYHGGPVMTNGVNVYLIWYGTWSNGDQAILSNLITGLNSSPYFNINTTYYDGSSVHVQNVVNLSGQYFDTAKSKGSSLSDSAIQSIVAAQNPTDTNGVYFVLTDQNVNATSGFCTQYCGWHTHATIGGRDIKYAFIGNPARCPSACTNGTTPPNGSVGADGAASIVAHELEEAATDPDLNAWYDTRGYENADKCAWTFGSTYKTANGGTANVALGGKDYLIQQNWVNAGNGSCAMKY